MRLICVIVAPAATTKCVTAASTSSTAAVSADVATANAIATTATVTTLATANVCRCHYLAHLSLESLFKAVTSE